MDLLAHEPKKLLRKYCAMATPTGYAGRWPLPWLACNVARASRIMWPLFSCEITNEQIWFFSCALVYRRQADVKVLWFKRPPLHIHTAIPQSKNKHSRVSVKTRRSCHQEEEPVITVSDSLEPYCVLSCIVNNRRTQYYLVLWTFFQTPEVTSNKKWPYSFGHTHSIVDPNLIFSIRFTKPPWSSTVPPSLFSPIKRFSESDTKDQVRIRIRWKSVVCGWSLNVVLLVYLLLQLTNVSQENLLFCPLFLFVFSLTCPGEPLPCLKANNRH